MPRLLPTLLLPLALTACDGVRRAVAVPAHFTSHQICSAVFVGGLDADTFFAQGVAPQMRPGDALTRYEVDRAKGTVTAHFAGLVKSTAVYEGPAGCRVLTAEDPPPRPRVTLPPPAPPLLPAIAGPAVVTPTDPALTAALDRAFAEPDGAARRWTKAVVILREGKVVAERYAPGVGVDTPLIGWSMTKSVTNALIGILVRRGELTVDQRLEVPAWDHDVRRDITVDSLLRMTSGLDFGQSLTADWTSMADPTTQMVYARADMAAMVEAAPAKAASGQAWTYSNGNTLLLSRLIKQRTGGGGADVLAFAHRELFDPLGMEHATLELDATGTPIGSSHMWATARDWARFGQLFLDDGVVGGRRLLPEGWVDYSARLTPGSEDFGYGAGFWTNRAGPDADKGGAAARRVRAGMPADSFMARGNQGQSIVIIPSTRLVIVRLGMSYLPEGDILALERLVADAVAAFK
ncbi:serine hydrolase [Nitrospirillum sp. BR 11164]|uniref:serine hydrolase domain-containing protein n=1 Tax=Nitrospirillum sp. BR 11164 TaxID=3104324 RepID=UPI002AFFC546|nr:serine hydrolase [Nitrospirillum sp. BR 11164]MEA1647470.1 serine hydrolase [Nitrospirillum sp. BR 11164]